MAHLDKPALIKRFLTGRSAQELAFTEGVRTKDVEDIIREAIRGLSVLNSTLVESRAKELTKDLHVDRSDSA